jgi:hypothetical protein
MHVEEITHVAVESKLLTCMYCCMQEGEGITIVRDAQDAGWYYGRTENGKEGLVPETHFQWTDKFPAAPSTPPAPAPAPAPLASSAPPAAAPKTAVAKHPYQAAHPDELSFAVRVVHCASHTCRSLCFVCLFLHLSCT